MMHLNIQKKLAGADGPFNLSLHASVAKGEFITIYGPTGSGKTSLLRMLAGLMRPDQGEIRVEGVSWFDHGTNVFLPAQQRSIGMVFQDYALFPNMSVKENLLFALPRGGDPSIVDELLEVSQMQSLHNSRIHQLSGGQKQRVALARALVRKPELLLLDEALSALDFKMRSSLQHYILNFHQRFGLTTLLVTHDLAEVARMSKRVWLVENGNVADLDLAQFLDQFGGMFLSGKQAG